MGHVDTHNFLVVIYYLTKEKYILYSVNRLNKKLVKFEHEILELFQDLFSEKNYNSFLWLGECRSFFLILARKIRKFITKLTLHSMYTLYHMFTQFCLFMMQNAYVPEGGNERGRKATSTSISIFDFYGIKTLWFEFGNDIFTGNKMPTL